MEQQLQNEDDSIANSGEVEIVLAENLDIRVVPELLQSLTEALSSGKPVVIKAEEVQRVDTAALQLLLALFRQGRGDGIAVSWRGISPAIVENARLLDVEGELGLPEGG